RHALARALRGPRRAPRRRRGAARGRATAARPPPGALEMNEALIFLAAAVVCVPLAQRLGLGSVLGYLIAGALIGPWGLRLVDEVESTHTLAELGVVLLLFVIGL